MLFSRLRHDSATARRHDGAAGTVLAASLTILAVATSAAAELDRWEIRAAYPGFPLVRSIVVDPADPTVVYVAASTGGLPIHNSPEGFGVLKSIDGGFSFAFSLSGISDLRVTAIVIDPTSTSTLYAATDGGGVFKSTNAGSTWSAASAGLPANAEVHALAIDPTTPGTLYAGLGVGGVYKTLDAAAGWTAANVGLPALQPVWSLAVDAADPQNLYVATSNGVYRSVDTASSWLASAPLQFVRPHSGESDTATTITSIVVPPGQSQIVYAAALGGGGVFRSDDSGATWSAANAGLDEFDGAAPVSVLLVDPLDGTTLYAGTIDRGIFRSRDGGPWMPLNAGLSKYDVYSLALDGTPAQGMFAGTNDASLFARELVPLDLDHYRCFKAKGDSLVGESATLVDDFETRVTPVRKPKAFCEPVEVNGENVLDPTTFLTCYSIDHGGYAGPDIVELDNLLVSRGIDRVKPSTLCVPTELTGIPSALSVGPLKGYRLHRYPGRNYAFTLNGELGSQLAKFYDYDSFLTPVDVDGGGVADPDPHLTCLRMRSKMRGFNLTIPPQSFARQDVVVTNAFGTQTLTLVRPETLCVASLRTAPL